jgi:hypothetical protein
VGFSSWFIIKMVIPTCTNIWPLNHNTCIMKFMEEKITFIHNTYTILLVYIIGIDVRSITFEISRMDVKETINLSVIQPINICQPSISRFIPYFKLKSLWKFHDISTLMMYAH